MRPRGETQRRYNEAIQSLSRKRIFNKQIKYIGEQETTTQFMAVKRRQACPQTVLHLWDGIAYIRQQKQIPNFDRISGYMKRVHNLNPPDVERQLKFAVHDGLIVIRRTVGCKGTKIGVEQDGYRIPEEEGPKDGHDWYCFECHRGGEVILCTTCHRVYHTVCIKEDFNGMKFVCNVCKLLKGKNTLKLKKSELNTLLGYTCVRLKEKTKELHRIPHPDEERWRHDYLIYQQMDLVVMEDKMKASEYQRLEEFHADAQIVVHNVVVYFGVHSPIADMARQMLRDCVYDLNEIRQCRKCYRMSNEKDEKFWFCQPCDPPHELVFAKQKGFPYWPAKVIKKEDKVYDVRFFGGFHQRANIDEEYVKPITVSLQQICSKRTTSLNRALEELRKHQQLIAEYKKNLGQSDDNKTVLNEENDTTVVKQSHSRPVTSSSSKPKPSSVSKPLPVTKPSATKPVPATKPSVTKASSVKRKKAVKEDAKDDASETEKEKENEGEISHDESPSSSSPKNVPFQEVPTPEDHNVVSSSSQETLVSRVSVATQTPKKLLLGLKDDTEPAPPPPPPPPEASKSCDCNTKYSKIFRDFREHLEAEHKEDKARALRDLAEKLRKEMEDDKEKTVSTALDKFHHELEEVQRKAEEQHQLSHQQQIRKLIEQHQQEISETKKKQWCYNCEAEAIYHCCWNTSYCSVECQQVHWHKEHKRTCRRKR